MYNIITANITNIMLVGLVILVVMFSKNGQSRSSQLDIKTMVMIGLSLIM